MEKLDLLKNPDYQSLCSINAFVNCTPVVSSARAELLWGIPNSLVGLVGFGVVTCLGVVALRPGSMPNWLWYGSAWGISAALALCIYLSYVTFFELGRMCIYCTSVWMITSLAFLFALRHAAGLSKRWKKLADYSFLIFGLAVLWFIFAALWGLFIYPVI